MNPPRSAGFLLVYELLFTSIHAASASAICRYSAGASSEGGDLVMRTTSASRSGGTSFLSVHFLTPSELMPKASATVRSPARRSGWRLRAFLFMRAKYNRTVFSATVIFCDHATSSCFLKLAGILLSQPAALHRASVDRPLAWGSASGMLLWWLLAGFCTHLQGPALFRRKQ